MFEVKSISHRIKDKVILNDVSLSLKSGEHLLIHGSSGCGKSTLMHMMAGLLKPTSGSIVFDGLNYAEQSNCQMDKIRSENFGFIFQKMHLIGHLTSRQNIELADLNGVNDEIINDLGIKVILTQKASTLSIGESQRVALARALANKPRVIFADEPTSALDTTNADGVMSVLFSQAEKYGASLVVTSHDERIQSQFTDKLDLSHD